MDTATPCHVNAGPGCRHSRRAHRADGAAHRDHRSRRLLHPDEHGLAADVARRHPQQEVPAVARRRVQRRRHPRGTCRRASACSKRRCCGATRPSDIVCCYPADLDKFIGPDTRVVAVSTHNPLGVTFAAGVYTSIFGSSRQPINSHYARELFAAIKANPHRDGLQGDRRRIGRLADHPDQLLRGAGRRLRRRRTQRIGRDALTLFDKALARRGAAAAGRRRASEGSRRASSSPTSARRSASSR